jgi:hypothetical protein
LMQEGKKETEKPTDFFELEFKESNCWLNSFLLFRNLFIWVAISMGHIKLSTGKTGDSASISGWPWFSACFGVYWLWRVME